MSNYEISKSSLLSLKAEILRKQEEVKNKVHETVKKKVPLTIKNKGVDKRSQADTIEDIDLLEKSRIALEKKAKLYDKLSKSKITDDDPASVQNRFLVRFKDKDKSDVNIEDENDVDECESHQNYDEPENPEEEWVEYLDCLGRTRICLRKDLQYFKSKDKDYKRDEIEKIETDKIEERTIEKDDSIENPKENQLLSDDMRREILREQWEKEENELRKKNDIHYQDVLFSEARTHGVGYYGFSKDEEVRRLQQESLEKLRLETLEKQKKSQELKAMREKQLAARLKAARMRKRARLGLPIEEEEEEEEAEVGPPVPPSLEQNEENNENNILKERLLEEARRNHVRPWDIGKDKAKEFYEYSQEEWVEKRRKERLDEFAPPMAYKRDFRAPPAQFEITQPESSLRFSSKKVKNDDNEGIKHINPYKNSRDDVEDPFNEETRTFNEYNVPKNISNKRKYQITNPNIYSEVPIKRTHDEDNYEESKLVNDVDEEQIQSVNSEEPETTSFVTAESIEDSIEAGLRFLREQSEKRNMSSRNIFDL